MNVLQINKPGFLSLIVDQGRQHQQHLGLTASGPMDEYAYLWANRLLGNHLNSNCIEISLGLFSATFLAESYFSITGGQLNASLNKKPLSNWQSYRAQKGDILSFGTTSFQGTRAYLAIQGGFSCPTSFGSSCTVEREKLGGLNQDGEKLKQGDILSCKSSDKRLKLCSLQHELQPNYNNQKIIQCRFIPNSQWHWFSHSAQRLFCQQLYSISPDSNRMASKLNANPLCVPSKALTSEGVPLGAIQIPPNGQPIVLLRDRQTMGGYPKLGNVISQDIEKLAQAMPKQQLRFVPCSVNEAYELRLKRLNFFSNDINPLDQ